MLLACDHHGIDVQFEQFLIRANIVLTVLFAIEILLKLLAYTQKEFWSDAFNVFDLLVVTSGVLELFGIADSGMNVFRVMRIFKLVRVLRVLRIIVRALPGRLSGRSVLHSE